MSTPTKSRDSGELTRALGHVAESMREAFAALRISIARALTPVPPKASLWEERQALIDSQSTLSPERREVLLGEAAERPGLEEGLRGGDALFDQWKALLASEVSSPRGSAGNANT